MIRGTSWESIPRQSSEKGREKKKAFAQRQSSERYLQWSITDNATGKDWIRQTREFLLSGILEGIKEDHYHQGSCRTAWGKGANIIMPNEKIGFQILIAVM